MIMVYNTGNLDIEKLRIKPHGNSKHDDPYHRTPSSTMDNIKVSVTNLVNNKENNVSSKVYNNLLQQGTVDSVPRNLKQVQNQTQKLREVAVKVQARGAALSMQ